MCGQVGKSTDLTDQGMPDAPDASRCGLVEGVVVCGGASQIIHSFIHSSIRFVSARQPAMCPPCYFAASAAGRQLKL